MSNPAFSQSAQDLYRLGQKIIFRVGLLVQIGLFAASAYFIRPSNDPFILRYNAFFGVDILGTWWQVYLIPGICLVLFLSNIALAHGLMRRQAFLGAAVLLYGSALVVLSSVIAMVALITINS